MKLLTAFTIFNLTTFSIISCRKAVDIPQPINTVTDEAVYSTDATANAVINGLYVSMSQSQTGRFNGVASLPVLTSLSADDLCLGNMDQADLVNFFRNSLVNKPMDGNSWSTLYNFVYRCNAAIEGLTASKTLSEAIKQQLLGEAHFLRAFYYFHLVNLFGPIPLATTTDYKKNALLYRDVVPKAYELIVSDLKQADGFLSDQFMNGSVNGPSTERIRLTKWAAEAFLARVYLYSGDYVNATAEATKVIENTEMFGLTALKDVFLKNSEEAIWQLQPVDLFFNTQEARIFILTPDGFSFFKPFYLNPSLVEAFEPGDRRFEAGSWVNTVTIDGSPFYFTYKYKLQTQNPDINPSTGNQFMTEYQMVLRLAEQYLIRAEARAKLGVDLTGAISDLDMIRNRAGVPLIINTNPGISQTDLLDVILHERRVELFTESCHRWFDLKRTGVIDAVMSIETPLKGGTWDTREALYPLPRIELERAPNLTQNPGYPDL